MTCYDALMMCYDALTGCIVSTTVDLLASPVLFGLSFIFLLSIS